MKITIEKVAKELGISPPTLRKMIDSGELPIAAILDEGGKKRYVILPKPLYEETGIKVDGYEPPPSISVRVDYEKLAKEVAKEITVGLTRFFGTE